MLFNRQQVGESLARMHRAGFQAYDGPPWIFNKLIQNGFVIIEIFILQAGERANPDDVAVTPDHGYSLPKMLRLVAVHHDSKLGLKFPAVAIDIQHDRVHAKVESCLLAAKASAKAVIEEYEDDGLVLP